MKKNIIICIILMCFMHTSIAQHDSIVVKTYVGTLNSAAYKTSNATSSLSTSLRVGGDLSWQLNKKLGIRSFGVIDVAPEKIISLQSYWLSYKPTKNWEVSIGHLPMPSSEQRGFPVSASGHFETWTQSQIPGAAIGIKIKRSFVNGLTMGTAIGARYGNTEYHGMIEYKDLKVTGYFAGKRKGLAIGYSKDKIYSILVLNETNVGNTSVVTILPKVSVKYWSDIGFDHTAGKLVRCEGGLLKNFKVKNLSGLIALGYDVKISSVTAYLFIHI